MRILFVPSRRASSHPDLVRSPIVETMRRRSLPVAEIARRSRVAESRIRAFLDGRSDVTTATLSRLMEVLGLEIK